MFIIDLLSSILGFGFSLIIGIAKLIAVLAIAGIAAFKGYHAWLFALVAFIVPWPLTFLGLFLMSFLPPKIPKLPKHIRQNTAFEGKNPTIASIMALSAMIAKADGSVSREEVSYIRQFVMSTFGISASELNSYSDCFEYGKTHPEEYEPFATMISQYFRQRNDILLALAFMFIGMAYQESSNTEAKEAQARKIVLALGISDFYYQTLRNYYFKGTQEYSNYQYSNYSNYQQQSQEDLVKKYCKVLGVSEDASLTEIKKAYRKLVKEYHPDKLAADSVPPEYIEFATQKMAEINEAYEYLEKIKNK